LNTTFFNFSADRLPISIILLVSVIDFTVFALVESHLFIVLYCLFMILPRGAICAWNHHHQHRHVFKQAFLNRILEFFYALQTGVTSNLWLLHHNLGHHKNYLDQSVDESRWQREDGSTMGSLEYAFKIALTAYQRGYHVGKSHPKHQRIFITYTAITAIILMTLAVLNPFNTLFVFIIPMAISLLYTAWVTYGHHAGLHSENTYEASYNNLGKWFNIITGNLGYHTAHHFKQGIHWSELPALHKKIEAKIPPHLIAL